MGTASRGREHRAGIWTKPLPCLQAVGSHEVSEHDREPTCLRPSLAGAGHADTASQNAAAPLQGNGTHQLSHGAGAANTSVQSVWLEPCPCPNALSTRGPQGGAVDGRQSSSEEAALTTDRTFWHESRASKGGGLRFNTDKIPGGGQRRVLGQERRLHKGAAGKRAWLVPTVLTENSRAGRRGSTRAHHRKQW